MSGAKTGVESEVEGDRARETAKAAVVIGGHSYLRAPVPVFFPVAECVPESKRHLEQRTTLYQILKLAFAERAAIGCDQFVYWDPTDPRQCLAPDAFVRLGVPDDLFRSWKVWERGAPEVAVEVVSGSDESERDWGEKLQKYRRLGVRELVRFEAENDEPSLRIWDSLEGDLIERQGIQRAAASRYLSGAWVVVDTEQASFLRLAHDAEGKHLYPTPVESEAQARAQAAEAQAQAAEARAQAAEARARILELEAELRLR